MSPPTSPPPSLPGLTGSRRALLAPVLRLLPVLVPHRRIFLRSAACFLLAQLTTAAVSALGALLVARTVSDGSPAARTGLLLLALAVAVAGHGTFVWLESWWSHVLAYRILADLRVELHEGFERVAPGNARGARTGDLAGSVMSDVEVLEWFYAHTAGATLCAVLTPTALGTVLVVLVGAPGLVVVGGAVLLLALPLALAPLQARQGHQVREQVGSLKGLVLEGVQGLRELLVLGAVDRHSRAVVAATERVQRRQRAAALRGGLEAAASDLVLAGVTLSLLVLLARRVASGELDVVLLPFALVLASAALAPVAGVLATTQRLGEVSAAARRVLEVLDAPPMVDDTGPGDAAAPAGLPDEHQRVVSPASARARAAPTGTGRRARGELMLSGVRFRYDGGAEEVLRGVDLTVAAGSTVALVGASGAGKSTLADLLVRFYDPSAGTISLDGRPLAQRPLVALRREVGLLQQQPYIFRASVRENLRLALPGADDAELWPALEAAAVDDVVAALPNGLDHVVGEQGGTLSGGQRQRLALARAFLLNPAVLVMDEPLAHLDADNESRLAASTAHLRRDRTTVVIAHRLSTIRQAERVVLLEDGAIAADGSHDDLVARSAAYRSVLARQLGDTAVTELPDPGRSSTRAPTDHQDPEGG